MPACSNPASHLHVQTAYEGKKYCHLECICGEYLSGAGDSSCEGRHPAHGSEPCDCPPDTVILDEDEE